MRTLALSLMLTVIGCGKSEEKDAPADPAAGATPHAAPAGPAGATVTIDGVARPGNHGFVKRQPGGALQIYLGEGGSCEQLLTSVFDGKSAHVLVSVASRLAPDGAESRQVTLVDIGGGNDATPSGPSPVTLRGEPDAGAKLEADLAFEGPGDGGEKIVVRGTALLDGCGDQDVSKGPALPAAAHPSTATMTIAGKAFPIRGALRKGDDIVLGDFPRVCDSAWFIGAAIARERGTWSLEGTRFAEKLTGDAKGLTVAPDKAGTGPDGPTVELRLSGHDTLGAYSIALDGAIEALDCKP